MKRPKSFFVLFLLSSVLTFVGGCATLPDVTETIRDVPAGQEPRQIASAKGLLSPKQSKALMERLQGSVDQTDMLQRYTAVIESVSESPLTKGNKVTLLVDGPATYAAMFKAVENARDHINIETYIMEDIEDETGRKFAHLLLQKQADGVQVNLIYDSLGSFTTPAAFFQRLRDGGIQVVEFNPQNPLKARGKWRLAKSDHRKILIVDGKIAITGGVNISQVYSSSLSGREKEEEAQMPWRDTDIQIEGPAVAEFQKLFLDTWQRQEGAILSQRQLLPGAEGRGEGSGGGAGQYPGRGQQAHFHHVCSRYNLCREFALYDKCLFCP